MVSRQSSVVVLKDYISLTKPGVISLLILTTVASMYLTPAGAPSLTLVLWTFVGGWLMASGAHSVNCWADQDIDINMGRTSRRPIPSGRIPAWHALALGIALGVLAFGILVVFVNLAAALLSLAGYLYYVFIYTRWLKRTTPSNIVIGGGAGAFPPLVGWAAATGGLTLPALFLFAIIFYWTPPHFWALALIREKDYARANVPMLPVVAGSAETKRQILLYTILMLALTIMPTPLQMFGIPYLLMAIGLGAIFLRYVIRLLRAGYHGGGVGAVQVLAAVPGAAVRRDGGGSGGVCILKPRAQAQVSGRRRLPRATCDLRLRHGEQHARLATLRRHSSRWPTGSCGAASPRLIAKVARDRASFTRSGSGMARSSSAGLPPAQPG